MEPNAAAHISRPHALRMIAWELTRACNLACRHCRAAATSCVPPGELSTEEATRLLDDIASFAQPTIILTGGEPLLRADLFDIAAHAASLGLRTVAATNGSLLDASAARRLADAGVRRVSISLDGSNAASHDALRAVPGAFDSALRGIAAAREAGLPFQINTTLTTDNAAELPALYDLAVRLGAAAYHVFLLVPTGRAAALRGMELDAPRYEAVLDWLAERYAASPIEIRATCAPHFYRILRQRGIPTQARGCLAGQSFCFISHTGDVQPCGYFDLQCGNVRTQSLAEIWEAAPLFADLRDPSAYGGKCGCCEFLAVCGGCRARAYEATGDPLAPEPLCAYLPEPVRRPLA
ncbi:MAG: radical SAM protein [Planctomycetes bacterium]|nr:radical SAM protein [Planctomycetota bacterium]